MNNEIVLNHHSLPFNNKDEANKGLLTFFKVLQACKKAGLRILLVDEDQDKSLMGLQLAQGYFVRDWFRLAKSKVELHEWCLFLKNCETRQPLFEAVDLTSIDYAIEVGIGGEKQGKNVLLAAYYFKTFLASFTAFDHWVMPHINVWVYKLYDPPEETSSTIANLYNDHSLAIHGEELKLRRNELTNSATEIWQNRHELYPHLKLLSNQIGTALQNWSARQSILIGAKKSLDILEIFCEKWQAEEYNSYKHEFLKELGLSAQISGESK
ncbi:MAG: hypothetical protein OXF46_05575, partial [Rhodobacteraceae bacterium]|nr:hypothetical protein [Paracoccaceae bacterium]